jgi:hypothetical protein
VEQASKRNYFRSIAAIKDGFTGYASEINFSKPTITDVATLTELFDKAKNKDKWRIIPEKPAF